MKAWPLAAEAAAQETGWRCAVCEERLADADAEGIGTIYFRDAMRRERRLELRLHHVCAHGDSIVVHLERGRDHIPAPAAGGAS